MHRLRSLVIVSAVFASGAALAACGAGGEPRTVTVEHTTTVIKEVPAESSAPSSAEEEAAVEEPSPDSAPAGGDIRVPDVVGKDHQLAQDTMQSAGLYNLAEEDATGQGRMLLYDRNWVVVEQDPAPGSRVAEDATIILRSRKIGE